MSEESHLRDDRTGRPLLDDEKAILRVMLRSNRHVDLDNTRVITVGDGGMHCLAFLNENGSIGQYGGEIGHANYVDKDNILVDISLTVDEKGMLFELDFWKVDFQPLKEYPKPSDLTDISSRFD